MRYLPAKPIRYAAGKNGPGGPRGDPPTELSSHPERIKGT